MKAFQGAKAKIVRRFGVNIFLAILSGFFFACMQLLIQEAVKKFTPAFINIWRLGVTLCLLFVLLFIFLPNLQSIFNPNSSLLGQLLLLFWVPLWLGFIAYT